MTTKFSTPSRVVLCAAVILLLSQHSVLAQNGAAKNDQDKAAKIHEVLTLAHNYRQFNGTALVAENGKVIYKQGFGMANMEWGISNTPDTKFRLGSITKQFTSAAIMLLQERGKLSTSDPVCKYVTECPAAWEPITIKHLLTHTSGIPNYTDVPDFAKKAVMPISPAEPRSSSG